MAKGLIFFFFFFFFTSRGAFVWPRGCDFEKVREGEGGREGGRDREERERRGEERERERQQQERECVKLSG